MNYKIEKLYIKLNEKFDVNIKSLQIISKKSENFQLPLLKPQTIIESTNIFKKYISQLKIDNFFIENQLHGSFFYDEEKISNLELFMSNSSLKAEVVFDDRFIKIDANSSYSGSAEFNMKTTALINSQNIEISSNINSQKIDLDSDFIAKIDENGVDFRFDFHKNLNNISPIVDIFKLDPEISVWIDRYATFSALKVENISGYIPFSDPSKVLHNLYAKAKAYDLNYTFAQGFEPIRSAYTDLTFDNGALFINPNMSSTFYKQPTKNSWLKIDFSKEHYFINIFLDTKATLDSDILNLLNSYKIILPFKQLDKSYTELKMRIDVDLHDISTQAQGEFKLLPSFIEFEKRKYFIESGTVLLDNKKIDLKNIHLIDKNFYSIFVNGDADFENRSGLITAKIESLNFDISKKNRVKFLDTNKTDMIKYKLGAHGDQLSITPSRWKLNDTNITIGGFNSEIRYSSEIIENSYNFTFDEANISDVKFSIADKTDGTISGNIDINSKTFIFDLLFEKIKNDQIKLAQKELHILLKKSDTLSISSENKSKWLLDEKRLSISPFDINFTNQLVNISNGFVSLEDQFYADLNATIDINNSSADIKIKKVNLYNETLHIDDPIVLTLKERDDYVDIRLDELSINSKIYKDETVVNFEKIEKIGRYTTFFEDYNITEANATLRAKKGRDFYALEADVKSSYKLLFDEQLQPSDIYKIDALFYKDTTEININKKLQITKKANYIDIYSDKLSYNLEDLFNFKSEHNSSKESDKSDKNQFHINFKAKNGKLSLSKNRALLFDELYMEKRYDQPLEASLFFMQGSAKFIYANRQFMIVGSDFGDTFLKELSTYSDFRGGNFGFSFGGDLDEYGGYLELSNSTLINYKLLNNMLAFINTVPSLVTFAIPDYNKKGLFAKNILLNFTKKDSIIMIESVALEAQELKLHGKGIMDYKNDKIDAILDLQTDIGSTTNKIPLVGYVLLGDENSTLSTELKVDGNLSDPQFNTNITKSIMMAPVNIIKRALMLPVHLVDSFNEINITKEPDDSNRSKVSSDFLDPKE